MAEFVFFENQIYAADEFLFNANNRALRYGDGLFESIRIEDGIACHWDLHMQRLSEGCQVLKIESISTEILASALELLLKKIPTIKRGKLRVTIYRNSTGNYQPVQNNSSFYLSLSNEVIQNIASPKIGICPIPLKLYSPFSKFKTLNSLPYIYAANYMMEQGWTDVIILNQDGRVCEGLSSNIFWVKKNELYTTPISEACIDGIMRKILMKENNVIEKQCQIEELKEADMIYLTNAISGKTEIKLDHWQEI